MLRVHDACLTSECFFSTKCDCREQLMQAVQHVAQHGGIVIYLFQVDAPTLSA
jgi:GTP cyclohydrolase II